MSKAPALVWFRDDLRLADNPALNHAAARGPLICLYILDEGARRRPLGGAARWWLSRSLARLETALAEHGCDLVILRGDPAELLPWAVTACAAADVAWNRRYEAGCIALDRDLKAKLGESGVGVTTFNGALLHEPWEVTTKTSDPVKVFSPFWRAATARGEPAAPLPAPRRLDAAPIPPELAARRLAREELRLEPAAPDWAGGMREAWTPGEDGARRRLGAFLDHGIAGYAEGRDRPDRDSTSQLSPHLRFGEISPRQIWHSVEQARQEGALPGSGKDREKFLAELGWREFSYHLLFHNPALASENFNRRFDAFPWRDDEEALRAWRRGRTGYPLIDAGMRQLWHTGWMHNRVRMIVASFLIKHLLIDWRRGEDWFWDTLVDADPANNAASWQWVAGSGADAAPYFRIFNPVSQGRKFDPEGDYVRRWVPELARLDADAIHQPGEVSAADLRAAGVVLGETYPRPIVSLDLGRQRALDALATIRSS